MSAKPAATRKVALVGTGLIGRGWAILFANAGYRVALHDRDADANQAALDAIGENLALLARHGLIDDAAALRGRMEVCAALDEALDGACYVQESVPEVLETKRGVFEALGSATAADVVLASSCSSIPPERFMADVRYRERCLIVHPCSPPHLLPLVEIVTTRWTADAVTDEAFRLMAELGQVPVKIHEPVAGFAVNRLQAAVINEAIALVAAGVISPSDLDRCMSQGLGLRWAFMGPFETMDLNAHDGFRDYATKYRDVYGAILEDMGVPQRWPDPALDAIESWRRAAYPKPADVTRRRLWRDDNLMALAKLFRGGRLGPALLTAGTNGAKSETGTGEADDSDG